MVKSTGQIKSQDDRRSCALRALSLCDGQVLEDQAHALTPCPHLVLADATLWELHQRAEKVLSDGLSAVEPQLPL